MAVQQLKAAYLQIARLALVAGTVLLLAAGCRKSDVPAPKREPVNPAPQTVIMYLPWSGNLYSYFLKNIEDVRTAVARNILHDSRLLENPLFYTIMEEYQIPLRSVDFPWLCRKNLRLMQAMTLYRMVK